MRTENISGGTAESFGCTSQRFRDIHKLLGGTLQSPVRTAARRVGTHEGVLRAAWTLGHRLDPGLMTHHLFDGSLPPTPYGMNSG